MRVVVARSWVFSGGQGEGAVGLDDLSSCSKTDSSLLEISFKVARKVIIGGIRSIFIVAFGQIKLIAKAERTALFGFGVWDVVENVW